MSIMMPDIDISGYKKSPIAKQLTIGSLLFVIIIMAIFIYIYRDKIFIDLQ